MASTVGAIAFVFAIIWIIGSQRHLDAMASTLAAARVGRGHDDDVEGATLYQQRARPVTGRTCAACFRQRPGGLQFVADSSDEELLAFIRCWARRGTTRPTRRAWPCWPAAP
ncbi:MAG: hypothetical protein R3A10_15700 [Caldilineaceae bacterium]